MTKLTLKTSTLSPEKKAEIKDLKALHKKNPLDKEITFQDIKKAEKWLFKTYPKLFSSKHNKPLKIGIDKDIFKDKGKTLPFSRGLIRRAIGNYSTHPAYLKKMLTTKVRYDLNGTEAGTIDEKHKDHTEKRINQKQETKNDES